jgi:hypothetical protein
MILVDEGNYSEALPLLEGGLEAVRAQQRSVQTRVIAAMIESYVALALAHLGETARARALFKGALPLIDIPNFERLVTRCRRMLN